MYAYEECAVSGVRRALARGRIRRCKYVVEAGVSGSIVAGGIFLKVEEG